MSERICLNYYHTGCTNYAGGLNTQWCDKCWKEEHNG